LEWPLDLQPRQKVHARCDAQANIQHGYRNIFVGDRVDCGGGTIGDSVFVTLCYQKVRERFRQVPIVVDDQNSRVLPRIRSSGMHVSCAPRQHRRLHSLQEMGGVERLDQ